MLDSDAICRGWTHFWRLLLFFDAWFWCYLSWPEVLLKVIDCIRCLILMLYVVFQSIWLFYWLPSMLDFAGICRGRTPSALNLIILVPTRIALFRSVVDEFRGHFECIFYPSQVHFECYLWCSRTFWYFNVCLRCLILLLFVVAGHLLEVIVCFQKLILNAICRGRTTSGF